MSNYRPWGTLDWLLSKINNIPWSLIGCMGTEYRSLEVYRRLASKLRSTKLFRILDEDFKYSDITKNILEDRLVDVNNIAGGNASGIVEDHQLLETHNKILFPVENFILEKQDVILDVSSMPKRFFFPILKILFNSDHIRNLIVTYTVPKSYAKGKLSENLTHWTHLPLFSGEGDDEGKGAEKLIIGVGFDPMGIPQELSLDGHGIPIKLLFPFPAPLSSVGRAWEFVRNIEKGRSRVEGNLEVIRVEAKNPSDTFNSLCTLSNQGRRKIELAPFGPKAVSVAMCLFATLTESEVFYTQPKKYAPDYSEGVSDIFAYAIKLDGWSFYSLC
ncbi:MAG: hypothetical protein ACUZ8N_00280 [Candidatus Scalindua sp.]